MGRSIPTHPILDWKEPIDGGQVAAYKVQGRERPAGDWSDVATAMESEITLNGQTRSREFEFRVIAMNKGRRRRIQQQCHGGAVGIGGSGNITPRGRKRPRGAFQDANMNHAPLS